MRLKLGPEGLHVESIAFAMFLGSTLHELICLHPSHILWFVSVCLFLPLSLPPPPPHYVCVYVRSEYNFSCQSLLPCFWGRVSLFSTVRASWGRLSGGDTVPSYNLPVVALGLQMFTTVFTFYVRAGDLSSGPSTSMVNALATESSPQCPCCSFLPLFLFLLYFLISWLSSSW